MYFIPPKNHINKRLPHYILILIMFNIYALNILANISPKSINNNVKTITSDLNRIIETTNRQSFYAQKLVEKVESNFTKSFRHKNNAISLDGSKGFSLSVISEVNTPNIYIDKSIYDLPIINNNLTKEVYQLFSHGRSEELFIEGEWKNAQQIEDWFQSKGFLLDKSHLNIYGCNFAKGEKGKQAVSYLEGALGVSIAASDDITGIDGDWDLEVGTAKNNIVLNNYPANLRLESWWDSFVSGTKIFFGFENSSAASMMACAGTVGGTADGDDFDGDGVCNEDDLDDDNDGILDAVESPNCFYTEAEFSTITATASDLVWNATYPYTRATDGDTATFTQTTTRYDAITNQTIIEFTMAGSAVVDKLDIEMAATYTLSRSASIGEIKLQGWDGSSWIDLSTTDYRTVSNGIETFTNTLATSTSVSKLRLYGVSGQTNHARMEEAMVVLKDFVPSSYPKAACNDDIDGDGKYNHLDPDSDGDGCFDAYESGALASNVDTVAAPYGGNGLADSHQNVSDTNTTNYTPIYGYSLVTNSNLDLCADSDGDEILDLIDLDDDNDGILDVTEQSGNCEFIGSQDVSTLTFNNDAQVNVAKLSSDSLTLNDITGSGWHSTYSNQTYSRPVSLEFTVDNVNAQSMIGLIGTSRTQTATNWNDQSHKFYFSSATAYDIRDFGGPSNASTYASGDVFKIDIDSSGNLEMYQNGISLFTDVVTDNDFQLVLSSRLTTVKSYSNITLGNTSEILYICEELDTDGDSIPNRLDPDSDGDGCFDAYESGARADNVDTVAGPYGGNGLANSVQNASPDTNTTNYTSTYDPLALSDNLNLCADTDNDGIPDMVDIDDDNDGVLDAVESPGCFYTEAELSTITATASDLVWNATYPYTRATDENAATFTQTTTRYDAITNKTIIEFTMAGSAIVDKLDIEMAATYTLSRSASNGEIKLQGWDGSSWIDLSTTDYRTVSNGIETFTNTLATSTPVSKLRLYGVSGTTNHARMEEAMVVLKDIVPSLYPKVACSADLDGDGLYNHLDPDSDGDGCTDAKEANLLTDNVDTVAAPYGGNGFADALQSSTDTNAYDGTYNYRFARDGNTDGCLDTDGDSIADVYDLDDDNDGVLDVDETVCPLDSLNILITTTAEGTTFSSFTDNLINEFQAYAPPNSTITVSQTLSDGVAPPAGFYDGYDLVVVGVVTQLIDATEWTELNSAVAGKTSSSFIFFVDFCANCPAQNKTDFIDIINNSTPASGIALGTPHSGNLVIPTVNSSSYYASQFVWDPMFFADVRALTGFDSEDVIMYYPGTTTQAIGAMIPYDDSNPSLGYTFFVTDMSLYRDTDYPASESTIANSFYNSLFSAERVCDSDNDGIPNRLDLDSDGDGCPDAIETGVSGTLITGDLPNNTPLDTTSHASAIAQGPYGSNGLANGIEDNDTDTAKVTYMSTYNPIALSDNLNACADTDGDGIPDLVDIDDDNDGVLDAVESPDCFYSEAEALTITNISSDLNAQGSEDINNTIDGVATTHFSFADQQVIDNKTIFEFELTFPIELSAIKFEHNNGTEILEDDFFGQQPTTAKIQAWDGTLWVDLTASFDETVVEHVTDSIQLTMNQGAYSRYRLFGIDGRTDNAGSIEEIYLGLAGTYTPSMHTKAACSVDLDGDGLYNHLDPDSDGDGCTDAKEANVITANIDTVAAPYGGNGFANSIESDDTAGATYTGTYNYADVIDDNESDCTPPDTDGDGVSDSVETSMGTDPNDACDYNIADISISITATEDCDGDGVIDVDELDPDGDGILQEAGEGSTDPNDPCDLNTADVSIAATDTGDCDGDGVTNADEINGTDGDPATTADNTNPNDACDLNIADVSSAATDTGDCDGDGVTNADEINGTDGDPATTADNTNPNDPCSLNIADVSSAATDTGDCDGDGVTNADEINGTDGDPATTADNTNPNDPCSLNIADVSSAATDTGDCDGDGVTNADEINGTDGDPATTADNTNPNDPCSLNIADVSSAATDTGDCDGDGVTNADEINGTDGDPATTADNTNPNDPCSLNIADVSSAATDTGDCDGDGVTNADEINGTDGDPATTADNTNPNDPCSLNIADVSSAATDTGDCDGDGVTNADEINGTDGDPATTADNTNPNDPCSLNIADVSSAATDTGDCDGDGVTNADEINGTDGDPATTADNTNPNDPCSLNIADVSSAATDTGDCDGDGVTNADEINGTDGDPATTADNTNPNDPCSLNIADVSSAATDTGDCDGDGVTNADEINGTDGDPATTADNTSPNDPCSLNIADVSSAATDTGDCDGDGVTNADEINGTDGDPATTADNTNPNDPCSLNIADVSSAATDTGDCDGDGVTNADEINGTDGDPATTADNTSPNDPCDLNTADVSSAATDTGDCDGDGVTNADEINGTDGDPATTVDNTNPNDACDLNTADVSSAATDTGDCDGDGVTNADEINGTDGDPATTADNTNPNDACEYNVADQGTPSTTWDAADCDMDGNPNGTDPNPTVPTAVDDLGTAPVGTTSTIDILGNDDFLPNDGNIITNAGTGTASGTVAFNPVTGTLDYTPIAGEVGTDVTVIYEVCQGAVCDQATVTITVPAAGDSDGDGDPDTTDPNPTDPCVYSSNQVLANALASWNNADCDGDGVTNQDEVDPDNDGTAGPNGTGPLNPCSLTLSDVSIAAISTGDCDGDGVTNADEINGTDGDPATTADNTNPNDPCDLNTADVSSAATDTGDCDDDGVTNADEINGTDGDPATTADNTNPNDPCSLNIADVSSAATDTGDCDGDGVTNADEINGTDGDPATTADNTNPNDPCSLNIADVSSAATDTGDCDGDGVTNADEINGTDGDPATTADNTNPNDPCSLNIADVSSAATDTGDCDGDGVTNADEINGTDGDPATTADNTSPNDPCSLNIADVSSAATDTGDCDGDGVTNADEINGTDGDPATTADNTNPNDPCDLNTADVSSAATDTGDCDGDGVTNADEINGTDGDPATTADNTNPNDPCDLNTADVSNAATDTGDCDGDGVTNADEINGTDGDPATTADNTNPNDACDLNIADVSSAATDTGDCDGDGVTNADEINGTDGDPATTADNTNPNDPCSLNIADVSSAATDTGDCDGDGVTNADEINGTDGDPATTADNTNPNDPCSLNIADVSSAATDTGDCDGDGVTNADEINGTDGDPATTADNTNPNDPCSLNIADVSSAATDTGDCDGDGVTNADEINGTDGDPATTADNTSPNDPCSLNIADVSSAATDTGDCDGDGVTNADEINGTDGDPATTADNTNPNDPCDLNTADVSSAATDTGDCDGDGVTNADEINGTDGDPATTADNTNPNDACEYNVADQGTPSTTWDAADCDMDGNPNGTDPNQTAPTAVDDLGTAPVGTTTTIDILGNDDFLPNDGNTITNVGTGTASGTVAFNPVTGTLDYTPTAGEDGTNITVVYEVCQGAVCNQATVTINVSNLGPVALQIKVFLQGSFPFGGTIMYDSLRSLGLIPLIEPYTAAEEFDHVGEGGGETIRAAVLETTGNDAIVDWVFVELRSSSDSTQVIATKSGLVQRDGDVVDTSGVNMLTFISIAPVSYYVAVRHRNHLGAMTTAPYALSTIPTVVDFTTFDDNGTYGMHAQKDLAGDGSLWGLWTGNSTVDKFEIFQGPNNDPNAIFFNVISAPNNTNSLANYIYRPIYSDSDVNMDGQVIFQGPNNEPNYIFFNVLSYPSNTSYLNNYIMQERLP